MAETANTPPQERPEGNGDKPTTDRPGGGRRRRGWRRRSRRGGAASSPSASHSGYLARRDDGKLVAVSAAHRFHPSSSDPIVDTDQIERWHLDAGLLVTASVSSSGGHRPMVTELQAIEGLPPEEYRQRATPFGELTSIDPTERLRLETDPGVLEPRVVELLSPIGKGQRCLIVAPPKAGKTTLLQQLAHAIAVNHPEVRIFVLLVDERPEEVTDWKRNIIKGEVFASSSDETTQSHIEVAEMVLERSRRLAELGEDVVVFMDSLTRMSRAYNNNQKSSGRILSGGIDARTMEKPRRFFGSARNIEHGGSLTIVATCLVDTGSRMDEVIFQEFKGTGNMEIVLTRDLFERRIFPCMHIAQSGTRKEEKLYDAASVEKIFLLRRALASLSPHEGMQLLLSKLKQFRSNQEFLASLQRLANSR
ncbi:MAG: transcription termination factor Rho [Thermoanaerobaculaceae bacterium]|nr:transcription termination factor Rho [Thermoanaerobaculaceae bacterium]MDI9621186.1 transcription termination factor Rho [Acidobacteriota bacterium]NLH09737.1 transcription termination factor Rho [Holophagae bacterium]HPW56632.1 transcription termination factor Rho [Thermoanaerobaculaceae bacterium]